MKALIALLIALIVFGYSVLPPERVVEEMEANLYTEMVCLGRATEMEYGWPNYKNLDVTCGE
jgi:hypothetical protein